MIEVSVLYPNSDECRFDMSYYRDTHIPLVESKLGSALKRIEIAKGLSGPTPDSTPPFIAGVHMRFDSVAAFEEAFAPHAETIMADIANYTNVEPIVQISELG